MQTKSTLRPGAFTVTAVGFAAAGSALFVLGFQAIVDKPHPGALTADLRRVACSGPALLKTILSAKGTVSGRIPRGPLYGADDRTDQWVQHNLPSRR